jgi:hypothetical protein
MTFLTGQVTLQLDILQNAFPTLIPLQKQTKQQSDKKKPKKKIFKKISQKTIKIGKQKKNRTIVPTYCKKKQKIKFCFFFVVLAQTYFTV